MNPEFIEPSEADKPDLNSETSHSVNQDRQRAWQQQLATVERITDKLGLGIDEHIKEPVAAFLAYGFSTDSSCEGHVAATGEAQRGLPYPWVEVYAPEPEGFEAAEAQQKTELEHHWKKQNLEQQKRMISLFADFYQGRETPYDARLTIVPIGIFGGFRVQSLGADLSEIINRDEQLQKLALYRKEFNDFTDFLKAKFMTAS